MAKSVQTLILDIDSSSAGACLLTDIEGRPTISAVKRVAVGSGAVREAAGLVPQLKEALAALLPEYAAANPKNVLVVVASPWFTANLRTLSSKSEKPVRVTTATVARAVAEYTKTEHESGTPLESVPITVAVNGYRTKVKKPLQGKTLAITLYESAGDRACVSAITDALHAVLPRAVVRWHSTPLVYAEAVMSLTGKKYTTIVDVGGEVTDVTILTRGTVGFVGSVPEGARSLARAVSTQGTGGGKGAKVEASLADSASRLVMLAKSELSDAEMQATAAALTEVSKSWQTGFTAIVQEAGNTIPVPHEILLVGENDELEWFSRVVDGAANPTGSQRSHSCTQVRPDFFAGLLGFGEGGVYDASLALAAVFFHIRNSAPQKQGKYETVLYSVQ